MSKTFVFTSYELYPINAGGCGVFLYYAIQELLQDLENKVIILLDMPKHECIMFEEKHQLEMPNGRNLRIICLSEWISDIELGVEYSNVFLEKSHRFYKGIQKIVDSEKVNYIEFFDYVGIGYFTLKAKKYNNNEFDGIQFGVRAHCTIDLMDIEQVSNGFDINKLQMYQMEKEAIQDADFLLVPSNAWGEIYQTRYGVNKDNIIISPPPVKKWDDISYVLNEDQRDVLFYGRIFQLKGIDMFIDAAVSFMCLRPESENIFYLVGYDGLSAKNVPYKNELLDRIPVDLRNRFVFTGNLNHSQLETLLKTVRFAVFPNYVESFCYSIHEIYNLGVPIICNEIPAFKDYFKNGENSLVYNGTSNGLLSDLLTLYDNEDIRLKISKPYDLLDNSKFVSSYKDIMNNYGAVELNKLSFDQLEKKEALCSLVVIMENQSLTFSFEKLMEDKMVDKNSIYLLFNEAPGTPIHFLGKLRYARKIDGSIDNSLEISNYVLVCYSDDKFDSDYLKEAVKILTNNPQLKYVGAQFTNRLYCNYPSLLEPDTYWESTFLNRIIIKSSGENSTIRDIYDVRFKELGEKKLLAQEGYILPSAYITLGEQPDLEASDDSYLFSTHHNSRSKEWIPSILYPFILKTQNATQSKFDINMRFSHYAKKKYHKLRYKVDQLQGVKGKTLSLLLNFFHRQFKKRF